MPTSIHHFRLDRGTYSAVVRQLVVVAGAMHAIWVPLYLLLGAPSVALLNIASTATYLLVYVLLSKRHNRLAVGIAWAEVLMHAAAGSLLLGWESGFHYFVLLLIPAVITFSRRGVGFALLSLLLACYLALDILCRQTGALQPLPWAPLLAARWINFVLFFVTLYAMVESYRRVIDPAKRQLQRIASTDPLSGLSNRAHFHARAREEIERSVRLGRPVALVLGDIDFFKRINDEHGHAVGDDVLVQLSALLRRTLRDSDVIARWGGEEFIALLPECEPAMAADFAERLRAEVEALEIDNQGQALKVTMSFGLSECRSFDDLQSAIGRADRALYQSKHDGRNRVSRNDDSGVNHAASRESAA